MGKGEIARYEQFPLFPQCFQKAWFLEASKGVIVWVNIVFPGFHQYQAGALNCLAQGHSHEKTKRIQCDSTPGPPALRVKHFIPESLRTPYLTLCHTTTTFDALEENAFLKKKNVGKEENAGNQHFLLFPHFFLSYERQI